MAFFEHLQQKLKELYREFPTDIDEINIKMKPDQFIIEANNEKTIVTTQTVKRIDFTPYTLDLFTSEFDFDFGLYAEKDLTKLLQYINQNLLPNGKKLLAYSLIEENFNELVNTTSKKSAYEFLKQNSQQNTRRLKQIAKRTYKVMEIIGDFPIRLTTLVTPRWLYNLNEGEFEEFLQNCNRMKELDHCFAGAQQ
jgi:hypothetical protein